MGDTTVVADLREASVGDYCPLCALVLRSEERFLEALIYEQVNDIGGREVLRAARGFCMRHSGMLANSPAALGSSIIAHDVVRALQRVLAADAGADDRSGLSRRWLSTLQRGDDRVATQLAPSDQCPACTRTAEMEQVYLSGLLELLADSSFVVDYRQGSGVCLPHLLAALRARPTPEARTALLAHQADSWHALELELAEFIRKSDYRYTRSEEATEGERTAWQRALRLLSGWRDDIPPPRGRRRER